MEEDHLKLLRRHKHSLVKVTICDAAFLKFFYKTGILCLEDIDHIKAESGFINKASEFYKLIEKRTGFFQILLEGLKATKQNRAIRVLEENVSPSESDIEAMVDLCLNDGVPKTSPHSSRKKCVKFDVYQPVALFTGREEELESLHNKVQRGNKTGQPVVVSQITSISGLGGIGKTQLSRQYIAKYQSNFDGNCVWLNAETEITLNDSFTTLAKDKLAISTKDADGNEKSIRSIVADVYDYFHASKSLFVFDNAENVSWLKQYLPLHASPNSGFYPNVIITSRNRDWDDEIEVIDLNELDVIEAVAMVKKGLKLENDDSQDKTITALVGRLQCFPLALSQAIGYIKYQQKTDDFSIADYVEDFERRRQELLAYKGNELLNDYTLTTMTTWKMTVRKIEEDKECGEQAIQILYMMAYLKPDNINREFFCYINPKVGNYKSAVQLLVKYSMVRGRDRQKYLSIHRLVQEVTKIELQKSNKEFGTLAYIFQMLEFSILIQTIDVFLINNIDHIMNVWSHVCPKYRILVSKYSFMPCTVLISLYELNRTSDELSFWNETKKHLMEIVGENHIHVLRCEHEIGKALLFLGNHKEALEKVQDLVNNLKKTVGEKNRDSLLALTLLGDVYYADLNYDKALGIYERVCDIREKHLPGDILNLLRNRHNKGHALAKLRRFHEALEILQQVYLRLKAAYSFPDVLKKDDGMLISVQVCIAECFIGIQDFKNALEFLEQNADVIENLTGSDKWEGNRIVEMTGVVLQRLGRHQEALEKIQEAHDYYEKHFGVDHIYTVSSNVSVACCLRRLGKNREAIIILKESLIALEARHPHKIDVIMQAKFQLAEAQGYNFQLEQF